MPCGPAAALVADGEGEEDADADARDGVIEDDTGETDSEEDALGVADETLLDRLSGYMEDDATVVGDASDAREVVNEEVTLERSVAEASWADVDVKASVDPKLVVEPVCVLWPDIALSDELAEGAGWVALGTNCTF
jgi:hypothetical protein